mmetsp:Transcript_732/g.1955  ORF Transcript_732/g.1955 Transcript_732/m.1955 type:complete len:344 (-) Transcript_732:313-1344(-)
MKGLMFLAAVAPGSAHFAPGSLQQTVDGIFEKYLPSKPEGRACPFVRISEQCDLFNTTMTEIKACHRACNHGVFECHLQCPKAKPTSVKELVRLGDAMICHKSCGRDKACHKHSCSCPFAQKHAACDKLAEVMECHEKGGDHHTCKLDQDAKELLLHEPWSLVQDVTNHVVDHVLPAAPIASCEEVRSCHKSCGHDHACHKVCPRGAMGALKEQCAALNETKACHQSCEAQGINCPFQKFSCHMKCPMSMPASVEELKGTASHMACHTECGSDVQCHHSCPMPVTWAEKKEKCAEYAEVAECHKGCGGRHECHMQCPSIELRGGPSPTSPNALVKEVLSQLII